MIDNFNRIEPLLYFENSNKIFFHCQIVRRAKDHKDKKIKESSIRYYLIRNLEEYRSLKNEIVSICECYGARAYISLMGKNMSYLNKELLVKLAEDNNIGLTRNPLKIINSIAGKLNSNVIRWIIDVDEDYLSRTEDILKWLDEYFKIGKANTDGYTYLDRNCYLKAVIPSKSGLHLIINKKFNTLEFNKAFPNVDIHKNSMGTLLYSPKTID